MNNSEKIKILYIDDEPNNLVGFKATFRFDYIVFIASNIEQAYSHLKANPDIRVIMCDQRMPDKTGSQFFEEMRVQYPLPVRMLITGYADIESVIDAVNKGHIFRYIKKPWTDIDIKSAIEEGNLYYSTNSLLEVKVKELQSAYEELGKFTYIITHDLRGPLVSVMGAIELAKSMDSIDELKELVGMMDAAIKKLDEFIKNTHEYYSIKRGMPGNEAINFNALVSDLEAMFRIAGRMDNIRFTVNVKQSGIFYSDAMCIKIVLNNLLSNAFKYQRNTITDKFVELDIDVNDNNLQIVVRDNGIGIHEDHIENIFLMFYRATSEESGSGFGLYNVKDALNKINGTVEVNSILNQGTTFKVLIPGKANGTK